MDGAKTGATQLMLVRVWSIFCQVVDNHGDLGVCWRLACDLAQRGHQVNLWLDDASALAWLASERPEGVRVLPWPCAVQDLQNAVMNEPTEAFGLSPSPPPGVDAMGVFGDVLIEAFGCDLPGVVIACMAGSAAAPVWINLEHLSAERFVERNHRLPSPQMSGEGRGLAKHFFYPGFNSATGGLLREPDLMQRQAVFQRTDWLARWGIASPAQTGERLVSLFCYEPWALGACLTQWAQADVAVNAPVRLLVTAGRASDAVAVILRQAGVLGAEDELPPTGLQWGNLCVQALPHMTQIDFDRLLLICDFNFVRGEDSVVRALWTGKPFIWQLYKQDDGAHHDKLDAFLSRVLRAPAWLRGYFQAWNADDFATAQSGRAEALVVDWCAALNERCFEWTSCLKETRNDLLSQRSLTAQLIAFLTDQSNAH
jgi:uncharacterized repeat protein (TIGR03837 family)